MKLYLGYSTDDYGALLTEAGAQRVLYSYAYIRGKPMKYVFSDMFIDSGAFSVETQKTPIEIDTYIQWLHELLAQYPQIQVYVNLDVLSNPDKTWQNQIEMENNGLRPMPVYHYGEPENYLEAYCTKHKYVGLGGLAVGRMNAEKLKTFWEYVYEKYPDNLFHIFGVNVMTPFYKYQPYSIDSISYIKYVSHFQLPGYTPEGLPGVFDISQGGVGWYFPIHWKDLARICIKTMLDWEKLEWLKGINEKFLKPTPQLKLL